MRTDIIDDQFLAVYNYTINKYIPIPQENSSSSGCNDTIQSSNNIIGSSLTINDKKSTKSTKMNTGSIKNMKQTNKNHRQTSARYGNRYVQKQQFNFFSNSASNICIPTTSFNRLANNKKDLHKNMNQMIEKTTRKLNTTNNSLRNFSERTHDVNDHDHYSKSKKTSRLQHQNL